MSVSENYKCNVFPFAKPTVYSIITLSMKSCCRLIQLWVLQVPVLGLGNFVLDHLQNTGFKEGK